MGMRYTSRNGERGGRMQYTFSFAFLETYGQFFLDGLWMTLKLSLVSLVLSTFFGTLMGLLRIAKNRVLRFFSAAYVEFVRGTPLLVQLYLFRYGLIILFPALFIALLEVSFNLFGNGLRDAFNPSLRGAE